MSRKRSAEELYAPSRGDEPKRSKWSPPWQQQQHESPRDSTASASRSHSEASTRRRSLAGSGAGPLSRASSSQSCAVEDSEGSWSNSSEGSSSADAGEDGGGDADEVVTVGGPRKPHIGGRHLIGGAQDLQARIAAFLPQLAAANSALGQGPGGLNMEDVGDDEQHIEMNLGLGVLEQVRDDGDRSSSGDSQDADSDSEREEKDTSHMSRLLGQSEARPNVGIEDLG